MAKKWLTQAEKLLALNMLLNVAKFYNGDWKPQWTNAMEEKWCFQIDYLNGREEILMANCMWHNNAPVVFKSKKAIRSALMILGEDIVKLALTSNY